MESYLDVVRSLVAHFDKYSIQKTPMKFNYQADALVTFDSTSELSLGQTIPIEYIKRPSIELDNAVATETYIDD